MVTEAVPVVEPTKVVDASPLPLKDETPNEFPKASV
jgi:hypothetical protein